MAPFEFDRYPVRLVTKRPPRIAQPEVITETWYRDLKARNVSDHLIFGGDAIRPTMFLFGNQLFRVPVTSRERPCLLFNPDELPNQLQDSLKPLGASTIALVE